MKLRLCYNCVNFRIIPSRVEYGWYGEHDKYPAELDCQIFSYNTNANIDEYFDHYDLRQVLETALTCNEYQERDD